MKVEHNISRLEHLLKLYRLSVQDFLVEISENLKHPLTKTDIFSERIKVSHLKRIDKLFEKGLYYYLDPKPPITSDDASVFFRKPNFGKKELNLAAIKIVNQFEEIKLSLSAISKLSDLKFERLFPKYSVEHNPKEVAAIVREKLYPEFEKEPRNFLKSLISRFAEHNIMVLEFIETWNKKEKANIDGFFLKPNMIVLKRYQYFNREIFTLAHELGHYLLEKEEAEIAGNLFIDYRDLTKAERWCNDFAFYFLVGDEFFKMDKIAKVNLRDDEILSEIKEISEKTHLSRLSIYTRLLYDKKISSEDYRLAKANIDKLFKERKEKEERKRQREKDEGIKQRGSTPKAIKSPLFVATIQAAYYEGVLNEYEVCKKLKIKPENFENYIQ